MPRAAQKIRKREQGHEYAENQLLAFDGARSMRPGENPAAWLAEQFDAIGADPLVHPGNLRYAFTLGTTRAARSAVTVAMEPGAYPKQDDLDLVA